MLKGIMSKPFFERIDNYFKHAGEAHRLSATAASVMPNSSDIGVIREHLKKDFLESHLPTGCKVRLGGFLFSMEGEESGQIDVIVTTDSCPQYNLLADKCFSCVDGTLAAISIKSTLTKSTLDDALLNLSTIPLVNPLFAPGEDGQRPTPNLKIPVSSMEGYTTQHLWLLERSKPQYKSWPYKMVFATASSMPGETVANHIDDFYLQHPSIPHERRVDMVYVSGKYYFRNKTKTENGDLEYSGEGYKPDLFASLAIINRIQSAYAASKFIQYNYSLLDQRLREYENEKLEMDSRLRGNDGVNG